MAGPAPRPPRLQPPARPDRRRHAARAGWAALCAVLLAPAAGAAPAAPPALPARNLSVQWRVIEQRSAPADRGGGGGSTVSTQDLAAPDALTVTVLNGHWARLRVARSIPVQWVQLAAQTATAGSNGSSGNGSGSGSGSPGAAVVNAITWIDAGQGLALRVRWPGRGAAEVDLDADTTQLQPAGTAPLPATRREQTATTLAAPVGAWVTVAMVGDTVARSAAGRHWGTDEAGGGPRLMQLRLSLP